MYHRNKYSKNKTGGHFGKSYDIFKSFAAKLLDEALEELKKNYSTTSSFKKARINLTIIYLL